MVKSLRLVVYRSWGQIAVKDIEVMDFMKVRDYVYSTWKDVWKFKVIVKR